jgi:hypothetical protein
MNNTPFHFYDPFEFTKKCNELATIWTVQIWQAKMVLAANAFQAWNDTFFPKTK